MNNKSSPLAAHSKHRSSLKNSYKKSHKNRNRDLQLYDQGYRHKALMFILALAVLLGAIFGLVNLQDETALALVELTYAVFSFVLLLVARRRRLQFKISFLFLIATYSIFLFALSLTREQQTAMIWILTIPVLSHFLLGRWYGLWMSLIFIFLGVIIVLARSIFVEEANTLFLHLNELLAASVILALSHVYEVSRVSAHAQLLHLATTDNLTSLANRARFLDVFERERNHAERFSGEFSILLLDLDDFKRVNDRFGHDIGDEVLKFTAATLQHRVRKTDLACRIGGEEFAILLPGTNLGRAIVVAEDIRQAICDLPYRKGEVVVPLTVSIGVAEYGEDGIDLESLYAVADSNMYKAKAAGRNQTSSRDLSDELINNQVDTDASLGVDA